MNNENTNNLVENNSAPSEALKQVPVMSTKDWVITLLITMIPVVNFIMLLVWAFSKDENPNKSNWAKANLIWMIISIILAMLFFGSIVALFKA